MKKRKKIIIIIVALIAIHIGSRLITGYVVENRIDDYIAKQGIKKEDIIVRNEFGLSLNLLEYTKIISLKDYPDTELRYSHLIYDPPIIVIPKKYTECYNGVYYSRINSKPLEEGQKYEEGTLGKDGKFLRELETINIK